MVAVQRLAFAIAIAASGFAGPGVAAPLKYTSIWFLGDSLSDPGNLYDATGGAIPESPPYFEGRRSNGPVWAEHIAQDFEDEGLQTQNFAYAYANAITNDDEAAGLPGQVPDLPKQIEMFSAASAGRLGSLPIASLFFGANDIFGAIAASAALPVGDAIANVSATAQAAANAVADGIVTLTGAGVGDFMVFNLPALDQTPAFRGQPGEGLAQLGTSVFNGTLAARFAGLGGIANVTTIDVFTLFNELIADPGAYGLLSATIPCIIPGTPPIVCTPAQADLLAFFDPVHPNRVVHAAMADAVREFVAPVPLPLPGLLLAGGLLALAGLRARARG